VFKLGLVDSPGHRSPSIGPGCDRCKKASETAARVLCDCEALAVLKFRHLGNNFLKPDDFADVSVNKILHFVPKCGTAECFSKTVAQKIGNGRGGRSLHYPP
jgi:hypothetical protein